MGHWIIERQEAHYVHRDQNHLDMVADVADALLCGASVVHLTDAEARLIESAPGLLASLRTAAVIVERLEGTDYLRDGEADEIHEAIAYVEGGE
tara:strand:- start:60 stop:341 length:282 start_codon:yes stop_codon:yes gene_type:complete